VALVQAMQRYNSKAKAGTAHKSLIPSVLAFCGRSVKDKWF